MAVILLKKGNISFNITKLINKILYRLQNVNSKRKYIFSFANKREHVIGIGRKTGYGVDVHLGVVKPLVHTRVLNRTFQIDICNRTYKKNSNRITRTS